MNSDDYILVVDDEVNNLEIIDLIINNKYKTVLENNPKKALNLIKHSPPALILLDIMMPDIDGHEICRQTKSLKQCNLTKIVFISGKSHISDKLDGYESGGDDYLTKPFTHEELLSKISVFMKLYTNEKKLFLDNSSLQREVQLRNNQLINTERMAFIGEHSLDIVHNLMNPLTKLKYFANYKFQENNDDPLTISAKSATEKIEEMIKSILYSVTDNCNTQELIDINTIINNEVSLSTLDPFFKNNIDIILNLDANLKHIKGQSGHFHQIIGNLIANSTDAIFEKGEGEILIESKQVGQLISITIKDTGKGIGPQDITKVFEPQFTTKFEKARHKGTGLGLPYCKKVIESYGGEISISSKQDVETVINFTIPVDINQEN